MSNVGDIYNDHHPFLELLPFVLLRLPSCERHQFLDFAVFNSQTLTLMLKEDGEDDLTLLVQLNLTLVEAEHFTRVHPDAFKPDLQVKTVDVGPLLAKASVNYQTNSMGQTIAVGGIRTTASMLLRSQRRIRLFLLEDSEGNDEDDEDECPDDSTQQEDSAADSFRVDKEDRCEDEDKENTMVD
nr:anaphase-promoting complex subunit 4-like [Biomphalaria glabrata]